MKHKSKIIWFLLVVVSAYNGVNAVYWLEKDIGISIIFGLLSIWMLWHAVAMKKYN